MFSCPCILFLPRMCVLMKDSFAAPNKHVLIQHGQRPFLCFGSFTSLCPETFFTDSPGDAVRPLCGLVGSGGAAVWDALWTRPLRGWEWRRSLRVHPQWRGSLRVLAQHRGCKHTQSSKSFSFSAQSEETLAFKNDDLIAFFFYLALLIQIHEFSSPLENMIWRPISVCINLNPWINSGGQRSRESPSPPPSNIVRCPSGCAEWLAAPLSSVSQLYGLALLYNYIKAWSAAQPQHTGYKYDINLSLQCLHPIGPSYPCPWADTLKETPDQSALLICVEALSVTRYIKTHRCEWIWTPLSLFLVEVDPFHGSPGSWKQAHGVHWSGFGAFLCSFQ